MDQSKPSRFPAALFVSVVAALLGAAAYRAMQVEEPAAAAVFVSPSSAPTDNNGEPTSNEIADFPQLD
jgi:hypothetical protein